MQALRHSLYRSVTGWLHNFRDIKIRRWIDGVVLQTLRKSSGEYQIQPAQRSVVGSRRPPCLKKTGPQKSAGGHILRHFES